ncbi:hypothetical protein [Amycolatopsis thermoflava]|uniref:hypothetical protein n=1 Tax=Amycolatopsis thermoflava TaxID=84480 RepID=UPI003F49E439
MRVLMTCQPFYSHLVPVLVTAAKALQRAGHEVAVATAPAVAPHLARAGIEHLPLPNVLTLTELVADPAAVPEGDVREAASTLTIAFAGSLAGAFARDVLAVAGSWKPDVLVRLCKEFGGYLAAERLGLPQAVLDTSPFSALNLPLVRDALNGQRAEFGLDTVDEPGIRRASCSRPSRIGDWFTPRTFRRTVATLVTDALQAREASDLLGHSRVSQTTDTHVGRNLPSRRPAVVLGVLDVAKNGSKPAPRSKSKNPRP